MAGDARSTVAPVTATREYDIVLYGATGFVGKLTAQYLARAGGNARIALAGRSTDRLMAIRETLGESAQSWPVLQADASSPSTLDAMAAQTQVVVTTVGPYSRYGLPLVAACAAAGTDYADLTGEPPFIRESIDLYHKQAARHRCAHRARVRIRFDPFGSHRVRAVPQGARRRRRRTRSAPTSWSASFAGGFSGGTVASMVEVLSTVVQRCRRASPIRRPLHAEPRPRRRTRTRRPTRPATAPRPPDRAGADRPLDRRIRRWRPPTRELCGAATHYRTGPTAGGSGTAST